MKEIFERGRVIRGCARCGRHIDVTSDEKRKYCYSCQLREEPKT